jgi:phenylacetate-coenzyme A ligase PaaK-like adenylate-forming protein
MEWSEVKSRAILDFSSTALEVFRYQLQRNAVYREFCDALHVQVEDVTSIEKIPFLPIETFKNRKVVSGIWPEESRFTSSGTTGQIASTHFIRHLHDYQNICLELFENQFGNIRNTSIFSLLPGYLERQGSGLVSMMEEVMKHAASPSGFYLNQWDSLNEAMNVARQKNNRIILLGVTFALLEAAEKKRIQLRPNDLVVETGGMKGRRNEITRSELHETLKNGLGVDRVYSEYGMTELMSQAYFQPESGTFTPAPWMKILVRDPLAPRQLLNVGQTGGLQVIDLGNLHSCSFLATGDLGKVWADGSFEVLGRFDAAEVRGCNLLVQ